MKRFIIYLLLLSWGALAQSSLAFSQAPAQPSTQPFTQPGAADDAADELMGNAEDSFLARYALALESLNASLAALEDGGFQDGAASLDNLERAARTLRPLSQETSSATLVGSVEATFERARTAIRNESRADLAVQVAVLKGGFRRLLYEAAVRDANAGNLETAAQRFAALATEMGLSAETQSALDAAATASGETGPTTGAALRLRFEQGVAAALQEALGAVNPDEGLESAYPALAEAYGLFIPIQDSPFLSEATSGAFSAAIGALVGGDSALLESELARLNAAAEALQQTQLPQVVIEPVAVGAAPTEGTPAEEVSAAVPTETASGETLEDAAAPEASGAPEVGTLADGAAPGTPAELDDAGLEAAPAEAPAGDAAEDAEDTAALELENALLDPAQLGRVAANTPLNLDAYALSESAARELRSAYRGRGFGSVDAGLEHLYATGALVLTAVERGDGRSGPRAP